jgi:hypothetical protein
VSEVIDLLSLGFSAKPVLTLQHEKMKKYFDAYAMPPSSILNLAMALSLIFH